MLENTTLSIGAFMDVSCCFKIDLFMTKVHNINIFLWSMCLVKF